MTPKKILIILGHPKSSSLCGSLVDAYLAGAKEIGYHTRIIKLGEHDAATSWNLLEGENTGEHEEPIWVERREDVKRANHMVFIFPTRRYTVPAILKGRFDRLFIPKFSHQYTGYLKRKKLLKGRTASVFTTCGGPRWVYRLVGGHPGIRWMKLTLRFVGIKPAFSYYFTKLSPGLRTSEEITGMIEKMRRFGMKGK